MLKTAKKSEVLPDNFKLENAALKQEIGHLKEQLEWLKRQVFGQKSERFVDSALEDELLPGLNLADPLPRNIDEIIVPVHRRKKKKGGKDKFKLDRACPC